MSVEKIFNSLNEVISESNVLPVELVNKGWKMMDYGQDQKAIFLKNKLISTVDSGEGLKFIEENKNKSDDEIFKKYNTMISQENSEVFEEMLYEEITFSPKFDDKEVKQFTDKNKMASHNAKILANIIKNKPKNALPIHWMVETDGRLTGGLILKGTMEDRLDQNERLKECLQGLASKLGYDIVMYKDEDKEHPRFEVKSAELVSKITEEDVNEEDDPVDTPTEESPTKLPKEFHVYWDKNHENAYYVVSVYPKENRVSYWNQDGDRKQSTIDSFMSKYELSTNEDDYDLFEEDNPVPLKNIRNDFIDYLRDGLKEKTYHWADNGEEADIYDVIDIGPSKIYVRSNEIVDKESDDLIQSVENLIEKYDFGEWEPRFDDKVITFIDMHKDDYYTVTDEESLPYPKEFLKDVAKAKEELKKYTKKQIDFVNDAYQDCIDNLEHWSQVKNDWAAEAAEYDIFENDGDFFKVFKLVDKVREVNAVAVS